MKSTNHIKKTITALTAALVFVAFSAPVYADSFDDQINAAKAVAAQQQAAAANLHAQADTYAGQVAQLQGQIRALQSQIYVNQLKANKLTADMAANQEKLAGQKKVLSANIKTMYLNSTVSPIEVLVSSNSIGDFFDQQQYRDSVKSKIQDAMKTILALQSQLEKDKKATDQILADARSQQAVVAEQQSKMAQLQAIASQNAAAADQQVKTTNAQVASLKAQQLAALAAKYGTGSGYSSGGACGGGYPAALCNPAQDTVIDNWGMYNRECVSYTAFRVAASGRRMPYWGGHGNANQWPDSARAAGIPMDGNPRVGDVAISMIGSYGHAMYVEAVMGGQIHVSQYNYGAPGTYSEMTISSSGLYFIHF